VASDGEGDRNYTDVVAESCGKGASAKAINI